MPTHVSLSPTKSGSYPHVIRLRGPWQFCHETGNANDSVNNQKTKLPCDVLQLLGTNESGHIRLSRRFGLPTNLEPDEHVELAIETVNVSAIVELNGKELDGIDPRSNASRFIVTDRLQSRNELAIVVALSPNSDSPILNATIESAQLEITLKTRIQG